MEKNSLSNDFALLIDLLIIWSIVQFIFYNVA